MNAFIALSNGKLKIKMLSLLSFFFLTSKALS